MPTTHSLWGNSTQRPCNCVPSCRQIKTRCEIHASDSCLLLYAASKWGFTQSVQEGLPGRERSSRSQRSNSHNDEKNQRNYQKSYLQRQWRAVGTVWVDVLEPREGQIPSQLLWSVEAGERKAKAQSSGFPKGKKRISYPVKVEETGHQVLKEEPEKVTPEKHG